MKVLIIVDVQRTMGHWFTWSYIQKLNKFLKNHAKDYDMVLATLEPDIEISKEVRRTILTTKREELLKIMSTMKADEIPTFILQYLTHEPLYKMYTSDIFNRMLSLGMLPKSNFVDLPTQSIRGYYRMYINPQLKKLITYTASATQVDIIGGGLTKCVELTSKLLKHYNIPTNILEPTCYDIRYINTNWRQDNVFDTQPIKAIPKYLLDSSGSLKMSKVPLNF